MEMFEHRCKVLQPQALGEFLDLINYTLKFLMSPPQIIGRKVSSAKKMSDLCLQSFKDLVLLIANYTTKPSILRSYQGMPQGLPIQAGHKQLQNAGSGLQEALPPPTANARVLATRPTPPRWGHRPKGWCRTALYSADFHGLQARSGKMA